MKGIKIFGVEPGSIAEEVGIEPGDELLTINNEKFADIFDYRYLTSEEKLLIQIRKKSGEVWEIDIEKDQYEDLGILFEDDLIDKAKSCTNKCIFCFIDQLPKGMRKTLYFKDDDSRLSFLNGNYVTLTNMKDMDIERIIRYRMTPVNVSVHTTNPKLRCMMLGNRFAGDILDKLRKLADGGIQINCQIVLCKGINDGKELDRTLEDLASLHPHMNSISVVPVGLTKYRENLFKLDPFGQEDSAEVVRQVEKWQQSFLDKYDSRLVYLADEFYLNAGFPIPDFEEYEDFPQIENGVGLIAMMQYEFDEYFGSLEYTLNVKRNVSIATGMAAYPFISGLVARLSSRFANLSVNVYPIRNDFFGEKVTVAGLVTGQDIVAQLSGKDLGAELLIPKTMLRAGETVFLDDYSTSQLEKELNVKIVPVLNDGAEFIQKVLGITACEDEVSALTNHRQNWYERDKI